MAVRTFACVQRVLKISSEKREVSWEERKGERGWRAIFFRLLRQLEGPSVYTWPLSLSLLAFSLLTPALPDHASRVQRATHGEVMKMIKEKM